MAPVIIFIIMTTIIIVIMRFINDVMSILVLVVWVGMTLDCRATVEACCEPILGNILVCIGVIISFLLFAVFVLCFVSFAVVDAAIH